MQHEECVVFIVYTSALRWLIVPARQLEYSNFEPESQKLISPGRGTECSYKTESDFLNETESAPKLEK